MADERENRNAVFNAPGGTQSGVVAVDRLKSELGLEIPVDSVPLPTRGKVYPVNSPLHGCETVDIKSMTSREEDILTSRALIKKGTVVTELIKSCLTDKSISVADMINGDRNALMMAIRITGYGPEYEADMECPACNLQQKYQFELDKLSIKRLEIEPVAIGENCFEFFLPVTKKKVTFKFLTGKDEEEILVQQERMKKLQSVVDSLITTRLRYSIVSIDGKTDKSLITQFVNKMPARDSLMLRKYMEKNEPGMDMSQTFVCSSCGHMEEVNIPLGISFFWPQS